MRPPRLAELLVRLTVPREDRRFVLDDLDEGFRRVDAASGWRAARRWYWWQVVRGSLTGMRPDPGALRSGVRTLVGSDFRLALRSLRRRPVYSAGAVGALALGLTSVATVFAVAWHVWLAPLSIPEPDHVVRVFELERVPEDGGGAPGERARLRLSPPLLEDLRRHQWSTLQAVAGVAVDNFDWTRDDAGSAQLSGIRTSPELASVLGLRPLVGRFLDLDPLGPEGPEVVLSEAFWQRAYGGDPGVVNEVTMDLDGAPHRVVGVVRLPDGYPGGGDVIAALAFDEASLGEPWRGARYLDGVGRVRSGHTVAEATAELNAFVEGLGDAHPQHRGRGGLAVPLGDVLMAPYRSALFLLLLAGGAFLALALVNVSGLVVIRRAQDRLERGVRAALGASRGRLLIGDVAETVVLGAVAGALGVLFTYWLLAPIVALAPSGAPRIDQVGMDLPLAWAILGSGLVVGVVVGVLGHVLTPSAPAVGRSPSGATGLWGRRGLVVGQVALTTVLATGGVAVLRYVNTLRSVDMGFEPRGVLSRFVVLSEGRHPTDESRTTAWQAIVSGLEARGITAAMGANPPITGSNMRYGYRLEERSEEQHFAQYHVATAGYFDLLGIPVLQGRGLQEADGPGTEPVVVVNEALARRHFPDRPAVGETLSLVGTDRRIVGVVGSTRHFGPDADVPDEVYVSFRQDRGLSFGHVLMRTSVADAGAILDDVVSRVDPTVPPAPTLPFTRHVAAWFAPLTLQLAVVLALGSVGLVLVALGLYALVAYQVSLRRREIGIRKALGAPVGGLFGGVVGQGAVLSAAGLAVGLAAWYLLLPFVSDLIVGSDATDVAVPLLVSAVVAVVSVIATVAPAWRSSAVDPAITLRAE